MYGAVSLNKNGHLNVRIMQYLKKHNIVYRSPQYRGCEGFPIGNGSFGGMLYHSADTIEMTLSHTDAIDFTKDGNLKRGPGRVRRRIRLLQRADGCLYLMECRLLTSCI